MTVDELQALHRDVERLGLCGNLHEASRKSWRALCGLCGASEPRHWAKTRRPGSVKALFVR